MDREKIKKIIEEFLRKLTVEFDDIVVFDTDIHPIFHVRTSDSRALIGLGGEHLRALNIILKKIVEKQLGEEHGKFLLDVNHYHEKKMEELKKHAQILAERARAFRHDVEMTPMNAYERMIIHSVFSDIPDIETHSEGEGKFRRVIIRYVERDTESLSSEV